MKLQSGPMLNVINLLCSDLLLFSVPVLWFCPLVSSPHLYSPLVSSTVYYSSNQGWSCLLSSGLVSLFFLWSPLLQSSLNFILSSFFLWSGSILVWLPLLFSTLL